MPPTKKHKIESNAEKGLAGHPAIQNQVMKCGFHHVDIGAAAMQLQQWISNKQLSQCPFIQTMVSLSDSDKLIDVNPILCFSAEYPQIVQSLRTRFVENY